jgi:hypothetical protein
MTTIFDGYAVAKVKEKELTDRVAKLPPQARPKVAARFFKVVIWSVV